MFFLQTLSLLLPILVAGVLLIIAIKHKKLLQLNCPVDRNVKFLGQPLFGKNKTWRGILIYVVVSIIVCFLLWLGTQQYFAWIHPIFKHNPIIVGLLYGGSYSIGELINSFIKRRLKIPAGQSTGNLQYAFDVIDGMIATIIVLSIVYGANILQLVLILFIGTTLHLTTDIFMRRHRLKR